MASQTLLPRTQVDNRDLYGYTTPRIDIVARPNDPFTYPSFSPETQSLLNALSSIQSGLQGYAQYKEAKNKKEWEEGFTARGQSEELTDREKRSKAFLAGWETLDGKIRARTEYRNEVEAYKANNMHLSPEEFQAGLAEISKKYLDGASDAFIKGFLEDALNVEEKALTDFQNNLIVEERTKLKNNIGTEMNTNIELNAKTIIEETLGITIDDLREWLNDGDNYLLLMEHSDELKEKFGPKLRELLTKAFKDYSEFGFDTPELSAMFLENAAQYAVYLGMPELLEYAFIKDPNGIAVNNTELGKLVEQYSDAAERMRNGRKNLIDQMKNEQSKELRRKTELSLYARVVSVDILAKENPLAAQQKAMEYIDEIFNSEEILSSGVDVQPFVDRLLKHVDGLVEDNYALRRDEGVYWGLRLKAAQGTLTFQDVEDQVQLHLLTREDANELRELALKLFEEQQGSSSSSKVKWDDKEFIDDTWKQLVISTTTPYGDEILGEVTPEEREFSNYLKTFMTHYYAVALTNWKAAHGGRYPGYQEWMEEIATPVVELTRQTADLIKSISWERTEEMQPGTYSGKEYMQGFISGQINPIDVINAAYEQYQVLQEQQEQEQQRLLAMQNYKKMPSQQAISLIDEAINNGLNISQIKDELINKAYVPAQDVEEHIRDYATDFTNKFFNSGEGNVADYMAEMQKKGFTVKEAKQFKDEWADRYTKETLQGKNVNYQNFRKVVVDYREHMTELGFDPGEIERRIKESGIYKKQGFKPMYNSLAKFVYDPSNPYGVTPEELYANNPKHPWFKSEEFKEYYKYNPSKRIHFTK